MEASMSTAGRAAIGPELALGQNVRAVVLNGSGDRRYQAQVAGVPLSWRVTLFSRLARLYEEGDEDEFWVFGLRARQRQLDLSDSDFGRMAITQKMLGRYQHALEAMHSVLEHPGRADMEPQDVSEFKGMIGRCLKRDQWDWLTVYTALGRPPYRNLRSAYRVMPGLRHALVSGDDERRRAARQELVAAGAGDWIQSGLARLGEFASDVPPLTLLRMPDEPDSRPSDRDCLKAARQKMRSDTRMQLEKASSAHQTALAILARTLRESGRDVGANTYIDAACDLHGGPALFEVKSINPENERAQSRKAVAQLHEYRYLHEMRSASLWVVFSREPTTPWLVDYLRSDQEIRVLWIDGLTLAGPDVGRLELVT
jgi:hypothetical protein